jgi:hypothetical protein
MASRTERKNASFDGGVRHVLPIGHDRRCNGAGPGADRRSQRTGNHRARDAARRGAGNGLLRMGQPAIMSVRVTIIASFMAALILRSRESASAERSRHPWLRR